MKARGIRVRPFQLLKHVMVGHCGVSWLLCSYNVQKNQMVDAANSQGWCEAQATPHWKCGGSWLAVDSGLRIS